MTVAEEYPNTELAKVLNAASALLSRFIAMSEQERIAIVLWCAMTWVADNFDVVPYLFITSAEKRCGKSLLLDLIEALVRIGRSTTNISPAALFRMIDEQHPTLLFDEVDNIFVKGRAQDPGKAELIGLINAGFRKGRPVFRMGGANNRSLEEFDAFGPKALAGIGGCLPDTTEDRCIPIRLERKERGDVRERYRIRIHEPQVRQLASALGATVKAGLEASSVTFPHLPEELSDRAQDIWEPLLLIAEVAGCDWPERARSAAVTLHAARPSRTSETTMLLADIRKCLKDDERILTKELVSRLNAQDESPWGDRHNRMGITSADLIGMLREFGLSSKQQRVDKNTRGRGFERSQFTPIFDRYLDSEAEAVDDVDSDPERQTMDVNTSAGPPVDSGVDRADQGQLALVTSVNAPPTDDAIDEGAYAAYLEP